jgi:NAD(P)-dependent dehydrogenase (short-subunit alcohol dehydrogenase family)
MMNLFALNQKTALVTGALGLIGKKHCEALAAAGANVIVADINVDEVKQFAQQLGDNHLGLAVDVTSKQSLIDALNTILDW